MNRRRLLATSAAGVVAATPWATSAQPESRVLDTDFDRIPANEQPLMARLESQESIPSNPALRSIVDEEAMLPEFGRIAFRSPRPGASGPPIVLFHALYGGVSHRENRGLAAALDEAGVPVWLMDLPGIGRSAKPKVRYDQDKLDRFVTAFLETVVGEPAHVVANGGLASNALQVAADRPDLVRTLSLFGPLGVTSYASPPDPGATAFYDTLLATENVSAWLGLLLPERVRAARLVFSDPPHSRAKIDERVEEQLIQRSNLDQRWISYAFITGQFWSPFATTGLGVEAPVQAIFSGEYVTYDYSQGRGSFGDDPRPETAADFQAIRPEFTYVEIPDTRAALFEKPGEIARTVLAFAAR